MSTLQTLLSNIKVEQVTGGAVTAPIASGFIGEPYNGQNKTISGYINQRFNVVEANKVGTSAGRLNVLNVPSNAGNHEFDQTVSDLSSMDPVDLAKQLLDFEGHVHTSTGIQSTGPGAPGTHGFTYLVKNTNTQKLEVRMARATATVASVAAVADPNLVSLFNAGAVKNNAGVPATPQPSPLPNPITVIATAVPVLGASWSTDLAAAVDAAAVTAGGENLMDGDYVFLSHKLFAIIQHYVADNTYYDQNGKLVAVVPAVNNDYSFIPQGGVGNYRQHLPQSSTIAGFPGAMALANYQPTSMNPFMVYSGAEGKPGQSGGGAAIFSNTPTVRRYCADSNYLVHQVESQIKLMGVRGLKLSTNSQGKVDALLAKLKSAEAQLCQVHELIDNLIGSTRKDQWNTARNTVLGDARLKDVELDNLTSKKDALGVEKRRLAVKALSTVLTLQDIIAEAVRAGKSGVTGNPPLSGSIGIARTSATTAATGYVKATA